LRTRWTARCTLTPRPSNRRTTTMANCNRRGFRSTPRAPTPRQKADPPAGVRHATLPCGRLRPMAGSPGACWPAGRLHGATDGPAGTSSAPSWRGLLLLPPPLGRQGGGQLTPVDLYQRLLFCLSHSYQFGPTLDLHTGGVDLQFPHHDNELAQCEAHHGLPQWCRHFVHWGANLVRGWYRWNGMGVVLNREAASPSHLSFYRPPAHPRPQDVQEPQKLYHREGTQVLSYLRTHWQP